MKSCNKFFEKIREPVILTSRVNYKKELYINRLWLCLFLFSSWNTVAATSASDPYYGSILADLLNSPTLTSSEIKTHLYVILKSTHKVNFRDNFDEPVSLLASQSNRECFDLSCYKERARGYKKARQYIFGIDLRENQEGFLFKSFYCEYEFHSKEFSSIAPGKIPAHRVINIEHVWPQSRFSKKQPKSYQKNDLHHLQVASSRINSRRGNTRFGEIDGVFKKICKDTFIGREGTDKVFQPAPGKRGNVARSLFYFSIRYKISISEEEERHLRRWHREDSVDEAEWLRHEEIVKIQKNRNPFVDHPELEARINDF